MRKKNVIINGFWSLFSGIIMGILNLLSRKMFLVSYDDAILGYSSLMSNLFLWFSVVEMGVGTVISYGLYREIKEENFENIAKLMTVYKIVYRIIGIITMIIGIVVFFLLPYIIVEEETEWIHVMVVYAVESLTMLSSYFMAYRRLLFEADQKKYICVKLDTIVNVGISILKILFAWFSIHVYLYLALGILGQIIGNLIISLKYQKQYPYAVKTKITLNDMKQLNFFHDIKYVLVTRVANIVYGGIDSIIATRMLGISSVTLMANYSTISIYVTGIIDKLLSGIQSSVGNLVYDADRNKVRDVYKGLQLVMFLLTSIVCVSYATVYQPFINMWLGTEYLLSDSYVYAFVFSQFVAWGQRIDVYFRDAVGKFEKDAGFMIGAAVSNIILSIIGVYICGLAGIIFATGLSTIIMWIGRVRVVYSEIVHESIIKYFIEQISYLFVIFAEIFLVKIIINCINVALLKIAVALVSACVVSAISTFLVFHNKEEWKYIISNIREIMPYAKKH